jgi:NTP pyrophosphatase (non-canonical NTP hydrolase)
MPLSDAQKQVDDLMALPDRGYWQPLPQLVHLVEEVGELARLYNHLYGDKRKKSSEAEQEVAGEVGDILFALICIANQEGIDLGAALQATIDKSLTRDKDRFK